jgi:hypothetical protein
MPRKKHMGNMHSAYSASRAAASTSSALAGSRMHTIWATPLMSGWPPCLRNSVLGIKPVLAAADGMWHACLLVSTGALEPAGRGLGAVAGAGPVHR